MFVLIIRYTFLNTPDIVENLSTFTSGSRRSMRRMQPNASENEVMINEPSAAKLLRLRVSKNVPNVTKLVEIN